MEKQQNKKIKYQLTLNYKKYKDLLFVKSNTICDKRKRLI